MVVNIAATTGAKCYHCVTKRAGIPGVGNSNEPFGTCYRCYVLACGDHGHLDPTLQQFLCIECIATMAAASPLTGKIDRADPAAEVAPIKAVSGFLAQGLVINLDIAERLGLPPHWWRFDSVEDLVRRYSRLGQEFAGLVRDSRLDLRTPIPRVLRFIPFNDLSLAERDLFIAAGLLAQDSVAPLEILPPLIAYLAQAVRGPRSNQR